MAQRVLHAKTSDIVIRGAIIGLVAGMVGSWAKSLMEPPLQRVGEQVFPPGPGEKALPGADTTGHPTNMPPGLLANRIAESVVDRTLTRKETTRAVMTIHYVFGSGAAIAYAIAAEYAPRVTTGMGMPAGALLWAGTHGSVIPLLDLQGVPARMPTAWYVWELGSHLGYGFVVEVMRRLVGKVVLLAE